jgi:hypothetical protein
LLSEFFTHLLGILSLPGIELGYAAGKCGVQDG